VTLARNLRLNQLSQQIKRLLPAEVAHLGWNGLGDSLLGNFQFRAAKYLAKNDRDLPQLGRIVFNALSVAPFETKNPTSV
jgi:hypothetical protein